MTLDNRPAQFFYLSKGDPEFCETQFASCTARVDCRDEPVPLWAGRRSPPHPDGIRRRRYDDRPLRKVRLGRQRRLGELRGQHDAWGGRGWFFAGYAWAANSGWIHFGDGSPGNGHSYANSSGSDYGVNHDGAGNLSGLAWAANTGWINLGTGLLATDAIQAPDTDDDEIADAWEILHFGSLGIAGPATHSDGDGVSDADEYAANTNPQDTASYLHVFSQSLTTTPPGTNLVFGPTNPARLYRIEYSNDLGVTDPWTPSVEGTFAADPGTVTQQTVTYPANPRKFFRIIVVLPLSP